MDFSIEAEFFPGEMIYVYRGIENVSVRWYNIFIKNFIRSF